MPADTDAEPTPEATQEQHAAAQKQAYIDALLRERRGYEVSDNTEGLAAVDAELKRCGYTRAKAHRGRETATSDRTEKR